MSATNTARVLLATVALCAIALLSSSAFAQARSSDGPRFRGGFSLVAGPYVPYGVSGASASGGAGGLSLRAGVQINHYVGVYVQSQNLLGAIAAQSSSRTLSGALMGHSQNSLMASLTIAHTLELAGGPSFDVLGFGNCDSQTLSCGSGIETGVGGHARAALLLGGWAPTSARRFGLSLSADVHPTKYVGQSGGLVGVMFGLGLDWF
jgi:hypothetical protein